MESAHFGKFRGQAVIMTKIWMKQILAVKWDIAQIKTKSSSEREKDFNRAKKNTSTYQVLFNRVLTR